MTDQEILAMQGTEFTYIFHDGDSMPAYIKKIDLEQEKMSCWSFSLITDNGSIIDPINEDEEKEQACCLVTAKPKNIIIKVLQKISTGTYDTKDLQYMFFDGCIF